MNEIRSLEKVETKPLPNPEPVTAPTFPELEIKSIQQAMGIETDSEAVKYQDKLQSLLEWAKQNTKDHSPEGLKWAIRSLELRLGTPPFSEKRVNYVARYAYLDMESKKIKTEMDTLAKGS